MKRLFLLSTLLLACFSFAFAEGGSSKAQNEAALKACQKSLSTKIVELQKNVQHKNADAISMSANDVLALMRQGVGLTRKDADLMKGQERDARYQHMLKLENIVIDYMNYNKDAANHSQDLVQTAQKFLNAYN